MGFAIITGFLFTILLLAGIECLKESEIHAGIFFIFIGLVGLYCSGSIIIDSLGQL